MIRKIIFLGLGFLFLAIGGIGILLPVLPTTPFVLCAAGCFGASSPGLAKKLENTKYFGEYIRNYKNKTGISRRARITGLVFLWLTLGISALLAGPGWVPVVLGLVGTVVSVHILTIRAKRPEKINTIKSAINTD